MNHAVFAEPSKENIFHWNGKILGPRDTPFDGGIFVLDIFFSKDHPFKPPTCRMRTKMFHPNISSTGHICLELFNRDWFPRLSVEKILLSISSILDTPVMDHPVNKKAAQCLRTDRHNYDCIVREYTRKYANESNINAEYEQELTPNCSHVYGNSSSWNILVSLLFIVLFSMLSVYLILYWFFLK